MSIAAALVLALLLDAALGWPKGLFERIGHPVVWIGKLIDRLDLQLNKPSAPSAQRRRNGIFALFIVVGVSLLAGGLLQDILPGGVLGTVVLGLLCWPFLAARSLHDHVAAVARPLAADDLAGARREVSKIVGRDPEKLDEPGVARAALESLAENASDGVTAPLFWALLLGLPGLIAYKAVNTLDSMIGHKTDRYRDFGWASARFDDLVNLPASRLTALIFITVSGSWRDAYSAVKRDAPGHRSPNAGWPEAAMAGALGVRLSGPRTYAGSASNEPWVNGDAPDPSARDITRGLALFRWFVFALAVLLALLALI